jgi:hypothetical protein
MEFFLGSGQLLHVQLPKFRGDGRAAGLQVVGHVLCGLLQVALWVEEVLVLREQLLDGAERCRTACPSCWGVDGGCFEGVEVCSAAPLPLLTRPGTSAGGVGFLVKVNSPLWMAAAAAPPAVFRGEMCECAEAEG